MTINESAPYEFKIGKIRCRNKVTGEVLFKNGPLVYETMTKANMEYLEGELIALLQRMNEHSKKRTAEKTGPPNRQ